MSRKKNFICALAYRHFLCIMLDAMSAPYYNLRAAARLIGISPQTLYDTYLPYYRPRRLGGHPLLSAQQVAAIKAEVRKRRNGKVKAKAAATA